MLVHIYIYEYIFPLHPLWLDLKIEKNYHREEGKKECWEGGGIMLFMRKTSVDSERERGGKKRQHILSQTPLVTAFVTRKQDSPPTLISLLPYFFFFLPLHLQHLQDKIAKLRGQSRFIIVMQKKLKCYPKAR